MKFAGDLIDEIPDDQLKLRIVLVGRVRELVKENPRPRTLRQRPEGVSEGFQGMLTYGERRTDFGTEEFRDGIFVFPCRNDVSEVLQDGFAAEALQAGPPALY